MMFYCFNNFLLFVFYIVQALVHFKQVLKAMDSWEKNKKRKAMDSSGKPKKKTAMDSDWENLPKDLLDLVLERLESISDYLAFSVVCKAWNGVAKNNRSQSRHTAPMLLISSDKEDTWNLYNVMNNKVLDLQLRLPSKRFCGSSKGWLIVLEENFVVTLMNPFSMVDGCKEKENLIIHLPPQARLYDFRESDYHVRKATISADPILNAHDFIVTVIYGYFSNFAVIGPVLGFGIKGEPVFTLLYFLARFYVSLTTDLYALVHSKEVIILHSDVVGEEVYPIEQLDFDDELKGLFLKIDVRNINVIVKYQKMHGCKTWIGSSKRVVAAESNEKMNKRFKGLVHSKEVIILHSDVVGDEVYPIDQLDFDGEMKGLFLKIDRGGDGKFFCRLCGMCWPDLAARNEHEVEHLSKFDVSCFLISGNCLNLSLNDRNNISCKKDLLSWIESVPDGVVLGDLADVYVSVPSDLKELIHSKEIVVLYSNVVGGEVVYPIKQLEFDDELKSLFKQFDVRNIDAVNKYLRMHGSKTWTGSSKRPADARESRKLNKRSLQKAESVNRCTEDVFEVFLNLIEDCCSLEGHCRMLRA
ncbi:unnamed protein product [Prunus armeniaca]